MFTADPHDPPMIGDKVFYSDDDENGHEIDDIDHEQPYANRGLYSVTLDDGDPAYIRNTGPKEWQIIDNNHITEEISDW